MNEINWEIDKNKSEYRLLENEKLMLQQIIERKINESANWIQLKIDFTKEQLEKHYQFQRIENIWLRNSLQKV